MIDVALFDVAYAGKAFAAGVVSPVPQWRTWIRWLC